MTDPTAVPDFPPPPDEHPLRGRVLDVLIDAGHQPDIDSDGDVVVTVQGQQMYVRCAEGAITILRVFGQWRLGDSVAPGELARLQACNLVTARLSIGKTTLVGDILVCSAEHVVTPSTPLPQIVMTSLDLVLAAVKLWHETLAEITGQGGPIGEELDDQQGDAHE